MSRWAWAGRRSRAACRRRRRAQLERASSLAAAGSVAQGLLLKVMDWDRLTKDDELGQVHVSLDVLRFQDALEFVEALPTQGSLTFSVTWAPAGRAPVAVRR